MDPIDLTDPDTYSGGVPHEEFLRLRAESPVAVVVPCSTVT